MLHPRWNEIMQEVDRLYHANTTSEGRIACITDYIVRELNALEVQIKLSQDAESPDEILKG